MDWKLADAQKRFGELMDRALTEGPQRVRRRKDTVVVLSQRDYDKLKGTKPSFKEFLLRREPTFEGLDLTRDRSPMRDIKR